MALRFADMWGTVWVEGTRCRGPGAAAYNTFPSGACLKVTLEISADYFRRIVLTCRSYPMLLAHLVKSPATVPCTLRQQCAADLLGSEPDVIHDHTTLKLRAIFRAELAHASRSGCLDQVARASY